MLKKYGITGRWRHQSSLVKVADYVAGLLVTDADHDEEMRGSPEDFFSSDGKVGMSVLCEILRPPTSEALKRGAIREVIASARSVALHGFQETRAWDEPSDYVVDTGEGSCGVVRFVGAECAAAMINYDPWRKLDLDKVISAMPKILRTAIEDVCRLPLLTGAAQRTISSIFWSEHGVVRAQEPWPTAYKFGGELLRRELLDDERWRVEASSSYELDEHTAALILNLTTRRIGATGVVPVSREEICFLLPEDSVHREEATELLRDLGFALP